MNSRTAFDLAKAGLTREVSGSVFEGERGSAGSTNCIRSGNDYSPRASVHIERANPVDRGDGVVAPILRVPRSRSRGTQIERVWDGRGGRGRPESG